MTPFKFSEELKYKLCKELSDYLENTSLNNKYEMAEQIMELSEKVISDDLEKRWEEIRGL